MHSIYCVREGSRRIVCALPFVQRDAGADPGFVFVEIDTHHFSLTHSNEIIEQNGFAFLRPDEHHPQFGF